MKGSGPAVAILLAVGVVYANSVGGAFVFDDLPVVTDNPFMRCLWPPWQAMRSLHGTATIGRPLVSLTLALNYAVSGMNPWSYHVLNIAVHAGAAMLLFGIIHRTLNLRTGQIGPAAGPQTLSRSPTGGMDVTRLALASQNPPMRTRALAGVRRRAQAREGRWVRKPPGGAAQAAVAQLAFGKAPLSPVERRNRRLAMLAALLWAVHPLNTECVAYITTRTESLMGLFFLATIYCFIRGWSIAAAVSCAAGMACKEVMAAAPIVVLLYDRLLLSGSLRQACRLRGKLHLALALSWVVLAGCLYAKVSQGLAASAGFHFNQLTPWDYARTQCTVLVHYLCAAVWPAPLLACYVDWPVVRTLAPALPAAVALAALVGAGVFSARRWPAAGWVLWACILILAPTSSFLPMPSEIGAERRMYLPLAGLIPLGVFATAHISSRIGAGLRWRRAAEARLRCLQSAEEGLAIGHQPAGPASNAPGLPGLAQSCASNAYGTLTMRDASSCEPPCFAPPGAFTTKSLPWGAVCGTLLSASVIGAMAAATLQRNGDYRSQMALWQTVARRQPHSAIAHYNIGNEWLAQGRAAQAIMHYERALAERRTQPRVLNNLGRALLAANRGAEALECFRQAAGVDQAYAPAHVNLGQAYFVRGDLVRSRQHLEHALQVEPGNAAAHNNLGVLLASTGKMQDAMHHYMEAIALRPDDADAFHNLGDALLRCGRPGEALTFYERVVQIDPARATAHYQRSRAAAQTGDTTAAREHCATAAKLDPALGPLCMYH